MSLVKEMMRRSEKLIQLLWNLLGELLEHQEVVLVMENALKWLEH